MKGIEGYMKEEEDREKNNTNEQDLKELFECLDSIKKNQIKLVDQRKGYYF